MNARFLALSALVLAVPASVAAQCPPTNPGCETAPPTAAPPAPTPAPPVAVPASRAQEPYSHDRAPIAFAVRTNASFVVDGVLDEAGWMAATPITDLRQSTPDPGAPATQKSEIRILYDDDNLYVGAWLFENRKRLRDRMIRRDGVLQDTDFLSVIFDSYHDHRVGYRFGTWPGGVQKDQTVIGDGGIGDVSWDAVWDLATSIDDRGWYVEMRIPFSQLRYRDVDVQDWGFQIERRISGNGETSVFSYTPPNTPSGVARYGHLQGIEGIHKGKRLELLPFVTGRAEYAEIPRSGVVSFDNPYRSGSDFFGNGGVDLKYRAGTALTIDGTVNPDFGQVEQDPAVINLTAFETRFQEKRPFFVEGADIFQFGEGRTGGFEAQLLYSRRIGRTPQGAVPTEATYKDVPGSTPVLGALKLSTRTASGWSLGVLDAVTDRVDAPWMDKNNQSFEAEVEPRTNYLAARLRREVRQGTGSFGVLLTGVNRALGADALAARLRSSAWSAGLDGRLEVDRQRWQLSGKISGSTIAGTADAISRAQTSSARYMSRPDADHLHFDPAATSLSGFYGTLDADKQAGNWRPSIGIAAISPGYEVNDLGFQSLADRFDVSGSFGYQKPRPGRHLRNLNVRADANRTVNFGGEAVDAQMGVSANATHRTFYGFNASLRRQFGVWDDRLTRGGPLTRRPAGVTGSIGFNTDNRKNTRIDGRLNLGKDDAGGWSRSVNLGLFMRMIERIELDTGPTLTWSHAAAQYVKTVNAASASATFGKRYVFAPLDQTTLGIETRLLVAFNPHITLELYTQPFISSGDYGGLMELARPRTFDFTRYGVDAGTVTTAADGTATVKPDGTATGAFTVEPVDFDVRSLIGNAVLRWEWRTGSTLFLVWQQTRSDRPVGLSGPGSDLGRFDLGSDARTLFRLHPSNVFMMKVTYWLNP